MPTLYVENVPEDLYEALRARAQTRRSSISAEVLGVLAAAVPTAAELDRRKAFLHRTKKFRSAKPAAPGPFPSTEEMQRNDRAR